LLCTWTPRQNELLHEWMGTEFRLDFPAWHCVRGKHTNRKLKPDMTLTKDISVHVEIDTGAESKAIVDRRMRVYVGQTDTVVWVSRTKSRMEWLKNRGRVIQDIALFTVLGERKFYMASGEAV
jgi:hypothetical protein